MSAGAPPLTGVTVLDFSTLLPGPLATRMLAAAGARVVKIERLGGEDLRRFQPLHEGVSLAWRMLNAGKEILELDLKRPEALARLEPLLAEADVLVEQFRPGVMARLGLDHAALAERFPRLIYCSITGYGQDGPLANRAGHDLNYLAETGILALGPQDENGPALPPLLAADIAGGTYPAVIDILLALCERERTGRGRFLDVSMSHNMLTFAWWAIAEALVTGRWPGAGESLVTGGSPRYQLYRTADGRWLAAAPLEDHFWHRFCAAIDLPEALKASADGPAVRRAVAERIAARPAADWEMRLAPLDVCCSIVRTLEEALASPAFRDRIPIGTATAPTLPLPLAPKPGGKDAKTPDERR